MPLAGFISKHYVLFIIPSQARSMEITRGRGSQKPTIFKDYESQLERKDLVARLKFARAVKK